MNERNIFDARSLQKLGSLSSLTPAQLERLAASMSVSWVNQQERRVLVSLLPPGEFFGLGFLFPQKRQPFRSDAFSDCTVGVLKPETLVDILMGVSFEGYLRSIAVTMGRMWGMCLRCVRGMGINLRKRVALELLELAAAFGVQDSRGTILSVRPTHEDLAAAVGASRQKVSECLGDFERHRVVTREGRRLIISPHRLREIVERG